MFLKNKIDLILKRTNDCLKKTKNPYLSMSWGKDSIFLLYFVRQIAPRIPVVFVNSGYYLPDSYKIRDCLVSKWDLNYTELQRDCNYINLCTQFGLPHNRTQKDQSKVVKYLKKDFFNKWAKENNYDGNFWGIRADESKGRMQLYKAKGFSFLAQNNLWRLQPIIDIKLNELWAIYEYCSIPKNQLYEKTLLLEKNNLRNSGWLSTDGAQNGRIAWLKHYYPEFFNELIINFPEVKSYV